MENLKIKTCPTGRWGKKLKQAFCVCITSVADYVKNCIEGGFTLIALQKEPWLRRKDLYQLVVIIQDFYLGTFIIVCNI